MPHIRPALALLCALLCFSACQQATVQKPVASPTATTPPAPTATPVLPPLTAEKGWHVVLTLGNVFGNPENVGGSFVATKPYRLFWVCEGSGTLQVAYPQATETTSCSGTPQLNGTQEFPPPPGNGQVTVSVTAEGTVMWEAIVEMQD